MPKKMLVVAKVFKTPTLEQMGIDPVRMECLNELRKVGRLMRKDFQKIFETWSKPKPIVKEKIGLTRNEPTAFIRLWVEDPQKFDRVTALDKGTKRHWVAPRVAKKMVFKARYRTKARPRWIGSRQGGPYGATTSSVGHWVKGIREHEFGRTMVKRWQPKVNKRLQSAANRGARKAKRQPGL